MLIGMNRNIMRARKGPRAHRIETVFEQHNIVGL